MDFTISKYPYFHNFGNMKRLKSIVDGNYPDTFENGNFNLFKNFLYSLSNEKPPVILFPYDIYSEIPSWVESKILPFRDRLQNDISGIIIFKDKSLCHYNIKNGIGCKNSEKDIEFIIIPDSQMYPTVFASVTYFDDSTHSIETYKTNIGQIANIDKENILNFSNFLLFSEIYLNFIESHISEIKDNKKFSMMGVKTRNKLNVPIYVPGLNEFISIVNSNNSDFIFDENLQKIVSK